MSRDTENWSNDAENSASIPEINYILNIYIQVKILFFFLVWRTFKKKKTL